MPKLMIAGFCGVCLLISMTLFLATGDIAIALAFGIASVAWVISWRSPSVLLGMLFALCSLIPSDYARIFRIQTQLGEIQPITVAVLLVSAHLGLQMLIFRRPIVSLPIKVSLCLSLFMLTYTASTLVAGLTLSGLRRLAFVGVSSIGIIFVVSQVSSLVRKERLLAVFRSLLFSCNILVGLLAVTEFAIGWNPFLNYYQVPIFAGMSLPDVRLLLLEGHLWRPVSSVGNPLVLAGFSALTVPMALERRSDISPMSVVLAKASLFASMTTAIVTASRSVMLLLAFVILLFVSSRDKKGIGWTLALAATVSLSVVLVGTLVYNTGNADQWSARLVFQLASSSITHRVASFDAFATLLTTRPFGIGAAALNNYLDLNMSTFSTYGLLTTTLDNAFLDLAVESSVFGVIFLVMAIMGVMGAGNKSAEGGSTLRLTVLVFVGLSFVFTTWIYSAIWPVFWMIVAVYSDRRE